jgi:serine/threonine-protein kinase
MTPERWRLVTDLFHAALARNQGERAGFVAEACRQDEALRAEVEVLLNAHEEAGSLPSVAARVAASVPLSSGTALGPYVIERLVGAGGMGEVYRASDTRLHRTVAIKILPTNRRSPDSQARFEREAWAISQLAHPHICTLHDVGHQNGTDYLVMEYLEGQTLADRLQRGPIPLDDAFRIGTEVASALDHAHRQGIVHRDLKPANIFLCAGRAKLLDFGVARILASADRDPGGDPGTSTRLTAVGTRPGTLQYMSPEQLETGYADGRSDIWALGCVLYEMFGGRKPFAGETRAAVADAILQARPAPLSLDRTSGLASLEHIVLTCLAKSPEERWQSAADVGRQLQWIARQEPGAGAAVVSSHSAPGRAGVRYGRFALAMALLIAVGAASAWLWTMSRPQAAATSGALRASVPLAESDPRIEPGGLAISPDGNLLVFAARVNDGQRLYRRRLDELEVKPIAGTDGAMAPFFSSDGNWIGFLVMGRGIVKMPINGGPQVLVCGCASALHATWGSDGHILFATETGKPGPGLWTVRDNGGSSPEELVHPPGRGALGYISPEVLPGNTVVLFTIRETGHTEIASLNLETHGIRSLLKGASHARYIASGHLLYVSSGTLFVDEFDLPRLTLRGAPRPLTAGLSEDQRGTGPYAVSAAGRIAYIPASAVTKRLVWSDRAGNKTLLNLPPREYLGVELSRDGRQLVTTIGSGTQKNLWTGETSGGPLTQLTFGNDDMFGLFSADGKDVIYTHANKGTYELFSVAADGTGTPISLTSNPDPRIVTSVAKDGTILFNDIDPVTGLDVLSINPRRGGPPIPIRQTAARELSARLTPDERWIAYTSDDTTGEFAIQVQRFPFHGSRRQVSRGYGLWPHWHPNGKELFYQGQDGIYAIPMNEGRVVGAEKKILAHTRDPNRLGGDWTIGRDGRLLLIEPATTGPAAIQLLLNLFDELKERAAPKPKGS